MLSARPPSARCSRPISTSIATLLVSPTVRQCAALGHVSVPYVAAAVSIADDNAARTAVLRGDCTVLDAAKADTPESLAEHFARATSG